ncbi:RBR-type E3 ubiquitin transferase [Mycena venus]|uniref:RBR-type E3 ubiquitin transferase n=1 Tax=Mycena venus TaxID=2733690 RepID=A0A8H6WUV1_9AGAR|nr:RBR-type E3 ubiquitin transferase [Mycena venus]
MVLQLYEIAQGLQYLHSRNIVHGDLRGANILINDDGSACLADFGLSRFSDATSLMSTNRGGSLYWMAPELIDPGRFGYQFTRTPATDVYAFGCVCLELYTGRPPFYNLNEPAALIRILNGERPERPSAPPAMSDILWQYACNTSLSPEHGLAGSTSSVTFPSVFLVDAATIGSSVIDLADFLAVVPSMFKRIVSFSKSVDPRNTIQTEMEPDPWKPAATRFTEAYDEHTNPDKIALQQAEKRAQVAEKGMSPPSCTLRILPLSPHLHSPRKGLGAKGPSLFSMLQSLPGFSESLAVHEDVSLKIVYHPFAYILIFPRDRMEIDDSDDEHRPRKPATHGIRLASCGHYFCGACLAQAIYLRLNIRFDPATYGTVLGPPAVATPGLHAKWPVYCPTCIKPEVQRVPLSDVTALQVLGEPNVEEWNHARLLSTLKLIQCPHKGCEEAFPSNEGSNPLMQCPRCGGSLCKACNCVWHENMTCEKYQAIPIAERTPEDADFMNLAKQELWRRCPNCSAMVELKFGCNHITCVCSHHFCYTCGAPFEYENGRYRCTGGENCPISVRTPEDADFLYLMNLAKQEKSTDACDEHTNSDKLALQQTRECIRGMGPPSYTWILPLTLHLHSPREGLGAKGSSLLYMLQSLPDFSKSLAVREDVSLKIVYLSFTCFLMFPRDRMEIDGSDDEGEPRKPMKHGIRLASCGHYFCGACLAQAIYLCLNIEFDPAMYGTVLGPSVVATPGLRAQWPIFCSTCIKPETQRVPFSDLTALQVLGEPNMEEWIYRRLASRLTLIQCPHKGCEEAFPPDAGSKSLMQCLVSLVWRFPLSSVQVCLARKYAALLQRFLFIVETKPEVDMTCESYQTLPISERTPEDPDSMNLAKQVKWRRCPNCSTMAELKFGCDHITCVCEHHFCYTCGAPFEYENGRYRCTGGENCVVWEEQKVDDY